MLLNMGTYKKANSVLGLVIFYNLPRVLTFSNIRAKIKLWIILIFNALFLLMLTSAGISGSNVRQRIKK